MLNSVTILLNPDPAASSLHESPMDIRLSLLKGISRGLPSIEENKDILENCSIFFSSMTLTKLKTLKCKHLVHFKCFKDWIMAGGDKCPICSEDITG